MARKGVVFAEFWPISAALMGGNVDVKYREAIFRMILLNCAAGICRVLQPLQSSYACALLKKVRKSYSISPQL